MSNPSTERGNSGSLLFATMTLAAGVAIAWIDTRPTWDDTGIAAGALLVAAALGGVSGLRPWLAALLVVTPLLIAELGTSGIGLLIPAVVAFVGAYGGALGWHVLRRASKYAERRVQQGAVQQSRE